MDQKGGYGIVYREIMRSKELTPEAKAIYAYLCSFAGSGSSCYPGAELMRTELQMGADRFYKHIHLLTAAGIVRKEQSRNGNRWGNTIYVLNHVPDFQLSQNEDTENTSAESQQSDFQLSQNRCTENEYTENRCTQNRDIINNSLNSNSFNNNSQKNIYGQQVDRVYDYMNTGRELRRSNGRLTKSKKGDGAIQKLLKDGFSFDEISEAARKAGRNPDSNWDMLLDAAYELKAKGGI